MASTTRARGAGLHQEKKDGGGWALPGFSLFSDDSDSDYNRDRDSDDDSKASDDSISDVSDDDLKGGGKHRKRRRQNDWRWAIVCGLLFLAFVFYEEILDAASMKKAWVEDLREGKVSPRRALDKPAVVTPGDLLDANANVAGKGKEFAEAKDLIPSPPSPPSVDGVADPVFRAKLDVVQEHMDQATRRHAEEEKSHGETKEQLRAAQERIAQLEAVTQQ